LRFPRSGGLKGRPYDRSDLTADDQTEARRSRNRRMKMNVVDAAERLAGEP
jgi:hypothetical protein